MTTRPILRVGNLMTVDPVTIDAEAAVHEAELLLKSFEVRYLKRGEWASRQAMIDHLYASTPEYNRLWAHPITWSWTRRDLHEWAEKKTAGLC